MSKSIQKIFSQLQRNSTMTILGVIIALVTIIAIFFTYIQVNQEQTRLTNDLEYRSSLVADSLRESVEPNFINKSDTYLQSVVERFADNQRISGLAVIDSTGRTVAVSSSLPKNIPQFNQTVTDVMDSDAEEGTFVTVGSKNLYIYATPLHNNKNVVGALAIVQNATYINTRLFGMWENSLVRLLVQVVLLSIALILFVRWVILKPIQLLANSLQEVRLNRYKERTNFFSRHTLFGPIVKEFSNMQQSLLQARLAASEEARLSLEKLDSPWTAERLKEFTKDMLKNRKLIAVSNLEPYIHTKSGNTVTYHMPASGLITGIEPVMEACGGMWIAQGSGDADKLVVDENSTMQVPPEEPKYTLKRVWLTQEEINGYLYGFADLAMYPLFHVAHIRPVFNEKDWEQYKSVNAKFAQTILKEIKYLHKPVIFIQDFQFTLLPKMIKRVRPDATIGLFWHIPWVSPETFSICPWKKEIIDGMLGADLIGFHTQQHCNNFIETVGREVEALVDYEQFTITHNDHATLIKPFPISIAFSNTEKHEVNKKESEELLQGLGIHTKYIGIGVDRLDYIKGVLDRLTALEIFFDTYPSYKEKLTFIQISSPSESKTEKYTEFAHNVEKEVERINNRFKTKNWKPIVFLAKHHSHKELERYYKLSNFCLITSLHDGMNLVSKEFIAARSDEKGVLILSQFAGAAKELKEALIVNPYNGKQTAKAINTALNMSSAEQTRRMKIMRNVIKNYNIYRWSAEFLKTLATLF